MSHIIRRKDNTKIKNTPTLMGCTIEKLIKWLEFQFEPDMNWENHGKLWHIDHIIPISLFNCINQIDQDICFNWKNLQPLYVPVNLKKSNKLLLYYYFNSIVSLNRYITIFELSSEEYQGIRVTLNWLRTKLR